MWYVKDIWKDDTSCDCKITLYDTREKAQIAFIQRANEEIENFGLGDEAYLDIRKGDWAEYWEDSIARNGFYVEYGQCEIEREF